jgi:hypothetical protein
MCSGCHGGCCPNDSFQGSYIMQDKMFVHMFRYFMLSCLHFQSEKVCTLSCSAVSNQGKTIVFEPNNDVYRILLSPDYITSLTF